MKTVVIIGVGGLGSRHLQGIAKCNTDIHIEVVDPSESSISIAKKRYEEVDANDNVKSVSFYRDMDNLSQKIDLAIVATNADVRFGVAVDLLTRKNVKNLILEKVLFQKIEYFDEFGEILKKENVTCWVNHPRRMFPFYNKIKDDIQGARQVSYSYHGGAWGLACNGLHFLDHLSYMVGSTNLVLTNDLLDKKVYSTKRAGFIEFNGMLTGRIANHTFSLYSGADVSAGTLVITSDSVSICIEELSGKYKIAYKENNWCWEEGCEKIIFYQSELSGQLVDEIFLSGRSELPLYHEAKALHAPFIKCLLEHESSLKGEKIQTCRIT